MPSLYQITQDMIDLENEIERCREADDEEGMDKAVAEFLKAESHASDKMEACVEYITNLQIEAETRDAEYKSLLKAIEVHKAASKRAAGNVERIKRNLLYHMQETARSEIQAGRFRIKIVKNGGVAPVKVDPVALLRANKWDERFVLVEFRPNDEEIRKADADGEVLPEGVTVERGVHLSIK